MVVGLGWDTNKYDGGHDFDLDSSVFLLADTGKVADQNDFIFITTLQVAMVQLSIQAII